jgi:hypothetical protein
MYSYYGLITNNRLFRRHPYDFLQHKKPHMSWKKSTIFIPTLGFVFCMCDTNKGFCNVRVNYWCAFIYVTLVNKKVFTYRCMYCLLCVINFLFVVSKVNQVFSVYAGAHSSMVEALFSRLEGHWFKS